jgi:transglycosylase-like protein
VAATLSLGALLLLPTTHRAGADQVGSLKARARQVSQQLIEYQLQADAYQQQYSVATEKVANDEQAISGTQLLLQNDQRAIAQKSRDIGRLALTSYVFSGSVSSASGPGLFSADLETVKSEDVYATVTLGNLNEAIAQLHTARQAAQAHEALLLQQQAGDRAEQTREAGYLQQANATTGQFEAEQAQVTGQLAAAVAAQTAAQDAAAAALVAHDERNSVDLSPNTVDPALPPFLICVRQAESGGNYAAVSPNGKYMGAFQFDQPTWNYAANAAGRDDLVGVPPNRTSKPDQDTVAVTLYSLDGERPWLGDRCSQT